MTELPDGWCSTTLESIAIWSSGGTPSRSKREYFNGGIPWVKTGELVGKYINQTEETLSELGIAKSSAKVFPKGSVGIAMYGATIGKVSIWGIAASTNQACAVAQPIEGVASSEFLYHFLKSEKEALVKKGKGGAQPNISQGLLTDWPIKLPPFNEQRRIVEKIEAMFEEIDAGTQSLRAAQAQLGLYRQSLLKSAFEGRLTADWRVQNADKLEDPQTLLSRIGTERDTRYKAALDDWQKALTHWRENREQGKKPAKPKRMPTLAAAAVPFSIPENWFVLSVGSLGRIETGATPPTKEKENFGGDIPFFKPKDLEAGTDVREAREFLSEIGSEKSRSFSAGTILVTCIGATIGKTGLAGVGGACNQQINYIEPDPNFEPKFIYYQIISPFFQDQIKNNASSTTLPILNKGKFSHLPTIVCSPAEQTEIARILDAKLEAADALEAEITAALTRADALRQSILKKAFSGRLVPQDPTDEPAAALLDRIKSDRAAAPKTKRKRKTSA